MGIKSWLTGTGAISIKRTVLHFYDDESFIFKKLTIKDGCFLWKEADKYIKATCHFFKLQFAFPGYHGITGDQVTISFDRDILYDPHNILKADEKPDKTGLLSQKWVSRIATSKIYEAQKQKPGSLLMDKITWFLGSALALLSLAFFISWIT
jgi:hypothetical protein